MVQIAILGFGVVGSGTAQVLTENEKLIAERVGEPINIKYILDLRDFPEHPLGNRVVHDISVILEDPEISIVAEMMGGSHPAYDFSKAALLAGKSVVTSNKEVVSTFGVELLSIAREKGVSYLFEASVGGGIPIIRPMQTDLASNRILAVSGILNGTTNYILSKMKNEGAAFDAALKEAQKAGYAEANPAADVEGVDAARKIAILSALAYGALQSPKTIPTKGITGITPLYVAAAKALGGAVKLIGRTCRIEGKIYSEVSPYFVPAANPVSHIEDVFNGILVDTDMLGRALFYGAGAGKLPTASAVVADIIDVASHSAKERKNPTWREAQAEELASADAYRVPRVVLIDGCVRCAAKAKDALAATRCEELGEGKFALVSAPMSETETVNVMKETGISVVGILPVLN